MLLKCAIMLANVGDALQSVQAAKKKKKSREVKVRSLIIFP
jgi:hypothetical protein